jgi:carbon-monoxide dehydrogenase small subunit|tara:strand:- start:8639 stop:9154 length:516 start_codon:yes stop_codon:yes gene_type:complete
MTARVQHFELNGQRIECDAHPSKLVVDYLREDAGLTGTNIGCGEGVCGTCSILVDNCSARSCLLLLGQIEETSVLTIEGLAGHTLGPVIQDAFSRHFAAQCGYCTPAMLLIALEYLLDGTIENHADKTVIRDRLASVMCRCTGYQPIIDAIHDVAKSLALGPASQKLRTTP